MQESKQRESVFRGFLEWLAYHDFCLAKVRGRWQQAGQA